MLTLTYNTPLFLTLGQQCPIRARVSDHNILMYDNILFFNMMMQCRWNSEKKRFNNGFGTVETDENYQDRIRIVIRLLSEAVMMNPQIDIIGLAEAPIKIKDIRIFIHEVSSYPSLQRFKNSFNPDAFTSMGVATFVNDQKYESARLSCASIEVIPALSHRVQEFLLISKINNSQLKLFNLHLPYDLAQSKNKSGLINFVKTLFQSKPPIPTIVIGDFNLHPQSIADGLFQTATYIQNNNNLQIQMNHRGEIAGFQLDTVDGILRSLTLQGQHDMACEDTSKLSWYGGNPLKELKLARSMLSALGIFRSRLSKKNTCQKSILASLNFAYTFHE